jgi:hypothetical protein
MLVNPPLHMQPSPKRKGLRHMKTMSFRLLILQ